VAATDLPARAWPELVPSLLATMAPPATPGAPAPPAPLRTATLEALGYVCEEMGRREDDVLEQEVRERERERERGAERAGGASIPSPFLSHPIFQP